MSGKSATSLAAGSKPRRSLANRLPHRRRELDSSSPWARKTESYKVAPFLHAHPTAAVSGCFWPSRASRRNHTRLLPTQNRTVYKVSYATTTAHPDLKLPPPMSPAHGKVWLRTPGRLTSHLQGNRRPFKPKRDVSTLGHRDDAHLRVFASPTADDSQPCRQPARGRRGKLICPSYANQSPTGRHARPDAPRSVPREDACSGWIAPCREEQLGACRRASAREVTNPLLIAVFEPDIMGYA